MTIQFICRGNAFRSIIAEAYLKSLKINDLAIASSGTVAGKHKKVNSFNFPKTLALLKKHGIEKYAKDHYADDINQDLLNKTDIAICVNQNVYDEAVSSYKMPVNTYTWAVVDIGEKGRIPTSETEREAYMEDVYQEIIKNVNELIHSKLHNKK